MRAVLFSALAVNFSGPQLLALDVDTLMTGAVRRAKSVKTGRLVYRFEFGVVGPNALPPKRLSPKMFSFAGTDWIERDRESAATSIFLSGGFLRYEEISQPDGNVGRTAVITRPGSLEDQDAINHRPLFAGTFWNARQVEYVERHCARFRSAKPSDVAGVRCEVCELDVLPEDVAAAFPIHSPALAAGGTLRVHIAPQLGFALPLIEVESATGIKVASYQSKDFLRFSDDTYFPRQIRRELRAPNGETEYGQFAIVPELINQPIPESDFVVELPAGTHVRDERDATEVRRFELASASTSTELVGLAPGQRPSSMAEPSSKKVLAILGAVAIAIVCFLVAIRRLRARH
jgi:hypothetical protein